MEKTMLEAVASQKGVEMTDILHATRDEFRELSKDLWQTYVALHARFVMERRALRKETAINMKIKSLQNLYDVADATRDEVMAMSSEDFFNLCANVLGMTDTQHASLAADRMALLEALGGPATDTSSSISCPSLETAETASAKRFKTEPENSASLFPSTSSYRGTASYSVSTESNKPAATKLEQATVKDETPQSSEGEEISQAFLPPVPYNVKTSPTNSSSDTPTNSSPDTKRKLSPSEPKKPPAMTSKKKAKVKSQEQREHVCRAILPPAPSNIAPSAIQSFGTKRKTTKKPGGNKSKKARVEAPQGSPRERVIRALFELHGIGVTEPLRICVAIFSNYSNVTSTGFAKAIKELKQEGLIEYPSQKSKTVRLTESGLKSYPPVDPPKNTADIHKRILATVKKATKAPPDKVERVFKALSDGKAHSRKDLAASADYSNINSTGFGRILSTLKDLELTTIPSLGSLQLTDIAFPFGRDQIPPRATTSHANSNEPAPVPSSNVARWPSPVGSSTKASRHVVSPEPRNTRARSAVRAKVCPRSTVVVKTEAASDPNTPSVLDGSVRDRISKTLVELHALNIHDAPREFVADVVGYDHNKSTGFGKKLKELRNDELIENNTKPSIKLTEHGLSVLPQVDPPQDNAEMQERLLVMLKAASGTPGRMEQAFRKLQDGEIHNREELAGSIGFEKNPKSTGFGKLIAKMNILKLIQKPEAGCIQLTDRAFPFGRDEGRCDDV